MTVACLSSQRLYKPSEYQPDKTALQNTGGRFGMPNGTRR
jgi:hypothetical protein